MTADTVVWTASMTKAVTGACAMQLVEQGKLSLDGDIAQVIPELGQVQVLDGFGADGQPRLRAPKQAIILRHLLTHTSGFAYEVWNAEIDRYMTGTGTPSITTCLNAALRLPLVSDPGERWEYGISIDWAGKAVEAISGQTLDRYMRDNLLGPLGMNDTGFRISDDQRKRLARIHARTNGGYTTLDMELPQEPEFHMGGSGLYSTVGDYLKFARMILNRGTLDGIEILRPETVAIMSQNAMAELVCNPMKTAVPQASAVISPLRQRMIDDMNVCRFSRETQRNYLRDVGRFATLGRSPDSATTDDVRRFQIEQREAGVPTPTMNSIVSALRFFSRRPSIGLTSHVS